MNILNLGSGDNPMVSMINIDIRLLKDIDVVANVNELPFPLQCFDKVFSHNPFHYNPVCEEVAEVLKNGGTLIVTGQPRNPFFNQFLKHISIEELMKLGFELLEQGPIEPSLIVGQPKSTTGKPLSTKRMVQAILRKMI